MADILNYIEQLKAETEKEWFSDDRYEIKNHVHDGFLCEIKDKKLSTIKGNTLSGEVNAQDIIFEIDRLHNEVDLGDENKEIYIYYSLADQSADLTKPHNVVMSEDKIRFSWTIPSNATKNQGNIVIGIAIVGTEDGEEFVYKTRTTLYKVEKGFVLESNIGNMLSSKFGDSYVTEKLISENKLILLPMCDIRGYDTSGMNCAVYITEAENMDINLMKLALQRIGEDSICIIEGDYKTQVDLVQYSGSNNGMRRMSEIFRGQDFYGEVELQNIYRSRIADIAERM